MLSHKTFGPSKPGLHSVPFWHDSRRLRAHTGHSILDPCVLKRVRLGEVRDTDADPRQEETACLRSSAGLEKTHAWEDGNVLTPELDRKVKD